MESARDRLKAMRIENPRTNGEIAANAMIGDALAEPWRRLAKIVLVVVAVGALVVIAWKI